MWAAVKLPSEYQSIYRRGLGCEFAAVTYRSVPVTKHQIQNSKYKIYHLMLKEGGFKVRRHFCIFGVVSKLTNYLKQRKFWY